MGRTLFDMTAEMEQLYAMATEEELFDEQIFQDTLEGLMGEIEVKGAGYVAVINQLDMEQKKAKELADQFRLKAEIRANSIKWMKTALKDCMERMNLKQIDAGDYTIKLQKNGGKQPLVISGDVPESMCKVILEPDKDKIRAAIEYGEDVGYAFLEERGQHVVIK